MQCEQSVLSFPNVVLPGLLHILPVASQLCRGLNVKSLPAAPVLNTWSQTVVLFGELEDLAGGGFQDIPIWLLA